MKIQIIIWNCTQYTLGKTIKGNCKTIVIDADPNDTIKQIKHKMHANAGIPPEAQRFIFAGKILEDSKTLNDYNVNTNSQLHVVVRLRTCYTDTRVRIDWAGWNPLDSDHRAGPNGRGYFLTGHIYEELRRSNIRSGAQLIKIGNVDVTNLEYTRIVSSLNQFLRSEWSSDDKRLTFQNIPGDAQSRSRGNKSNYNKRYSNNNSRQYNSPRNDRGRGRGGYQQNPPQINQDQSQNIARSNYSQAAQTTEYQSQNSSYNGRQNAPRLQSIRGRYINDRQKQNVQNAKEASAVNEIKSDILEMKTTLKQIINQMALFHQKSLEQDSQLKEIKEMIIAQNRVNGLSNSKMNNNELNDEIKDGFSEHESIEIVEKVVNAENELKVDAESVEIAVYNADDEETEQKMGNECKESVSNHSDKDELTEPESNIEIGTNESQITVSNAEKKMENVDNEMNEPESKGEINANELKDNQNETIVSPVENESKYTFGDPKTGNEEFTKQYLDIPSHLVGEYLMVYNKCIENKDLTQVKDEIMAYLLSIGVKKENIIEKEIKIAFWKDYIYANVRLTGKHVQDTILKAKLFKEKATTLSEKGWKVRIYVNYDDRSKWRTNTRKQNKASNVQTNQMRIIPFGVAGVGGFSLPPLPLPAINLPFPAAGLPMPMPMPMINNNFTPMGYSINQNQNM